MTRRWRGGLGYGGFGFVVIPLALSPTFHGTESRDRIQRQTRGTISRIDDRQS
jgi:hypothetical protein